jgi:hypothetical protein
MSLQICPRCQGRFYVMAHSGDDFEHICNSGNLTLDQEDKSSVVKTWSDYTGDGTVSIGDIRNESIRNKLDGTRAAIEGEKVGLFTTRGNKAENTRIRQHIEFIKLKD